jgi:hypothetical protein
MSPLKTTPPPGRKPIDFPQEALAVADLADCGGVVSTWLNQSFPVRS